MLTCKSLSLQVLAWNIVPYTIQTPPLSAPHIFLFPIPYLIPTYPQGRSLSVSLLLPSLNVQEAPHLI
jgi:hypothetical protein